MESIHPLRTIVQKGTTYSNQNIQLLFESYVQNNVIYSYQHETIRQIVEHQLNGSMPIDYVIIQEQTETPYTYSLYLRFSSPVSTDALFVPAKENVPDGQLFELLKRFDIPIEFDY